MSALDSFNVAFKGISFTVDILNEDECCEIDEFEGVKCNEVREV
jgi:hypothetical protein